MGKKAYISIPITERNFTDQKNHAFIVATNLALKGWGVITPFDVIKSSTPEDEALVSCLKETLKCDAIYLCKDWKSSKQCNAELQLAIIYEKQVMTE